MDEKTLDRVADAIEAAQCPGREGPFGLYDYSSKGADNPHWVRDFRDPFSETYGRAIVALTDAKLAQQFYDRLTRRHIAEAAIAALMTPNAGAADGKSLRAAALLAYDEMRNTVAPRNSFTDALDALDAALFPAKS